MNIAKSLYLKIFSTFFSYNTPLEEKRYKFLEDLLDKKLEVLRIVWQDQTYDPVSPKPKGSSVGTIYKETKSKKLWLGKLGAVCFDETSVLSISNNNRKLFFGGMRNVAQEKIAFDAYYVLSCITGTFSVPNSHLTYLPIKNDFTKENKLAEYFYTTINEKKSKPVEEALHIMIEWLDDYHDLSSASIPMEGGGAVLFMEYMKQTKKLPDKIIFKDKVIPLFGLVEVLATSCLLGDIDVLGNTGNNCGFIVHFHEKEPVFATIVKVDPGMAFTFDPTMSKKIATIGKKKLADSPAIISDNFAQQLEDRKDVQIGTTLEFNVEWKNLTNSQQEIFLNCLSLGLNYFSNEEALKNLVLRKGIINEKTPALITDSLCERLSSRVKENFHIQAEVYFSNKLPSQIFYPPAHQIYCYGNSYFDTKALPFFCHAADQGHLSASLRYQKLTSCKPQPILPLDDMITYFKDQIDGEYDLF